MVEKIRNYYLTFKGEKGIYGKSHFNRDLYYIKVCKSPFPKLIVQYSIHAREYITSLLSLNQIEYFIKFGKKGTVYFLPLTNPDGVDICEKYNPLYKANGRGVDLNVNFPAKWGLGKTNQINCGAENFIGEYPLSELESKALCDFTLKVKPNATVSYHSKGEEIYWQFFQDSEREKRDYKYAKAVSDCTGYPLVTVLNSAGGYKDWCIEKLKIPALTIEVGDDRLSHPIGKERLDEIYQKNKRVIFTLTESFVCNENL